MSARSTLVFVPFLALTGALSGCYWSSPPDTSHRATMFDARRVPELPTIAPLPLSATHPIVLARFDTSAAQPIGGLYDHDVYSVSPLLVTYFYKDAAVEIFEHVSDGLRASGLPVLKDYAGHAEPALIEGPLRQQAPVLVQTTLVAFQHDQVRDRDRHDWEIVHAEIEVVVVGLDGVTKHQRRYVVEGRTPYAPDSEMLAVVGWQLAAVLEADDAFVAAIGAVRTGKAS